MAEVPAVTASALSRYVQDGYFPGGFLYAMLTGKLYDALGYADDDNVAALGELVRLIKQQPGGCYGGVERVDQWIANHGVNGIAAKRKTA